MKNSIAVVGNGAVGKTTLIKWLMKGHYTYGHQPTVFDNFQYKTTLYDSTFQFTIWDTAEQQQYARLSALQMRACQSFFIMFDLSNSASFQNAKRKWNWIKKQFPVDTKLVFVIGNKLDLKRTVDYDYVANQWQSQNLEYIEISLLKGTDIKQRIDSILRRIWLEMKLQENLHTDSVILSNKKKRQKQKQMLLKCQCDFSINDLTLADNKEGINRDKIIIFSLDFLNFECFQVKITLKNEKD